jgi:hypothetical protein
MDLNPDSDSGGNGECESGDIEDGTDYSSSEDTGF